MRISSTISTSEKSGTCWKSLPSALLCLLLILIALLSPATVLGQTAEKPPTSEKSADERMIIGSLYFHLPSEVTDPELLENVRRLQDKIELRTGAVYQLEDVQQAIRVMYYRNFFEQIRVFGEKRDEYIDLHFHLIPQTLIGEIEFEGNKAIEDDDLKYAIRLRRGNDLVNEDLERDIERIKTSYRHKGFMETHVSYQLKREKTYKSGVVFEIKEGLQQEISSIKLEGKSYFQRNKVLRKLGIATGQKLDLGKIKSGIKRLREFYRKEGFEEVRVSLLDQNPTQWKESDLYMKGKVRISIDCGKRVKLLFSGNKHYSPKDITSAIELPRGNIFSYSYTTLMKMKSKLKSFYQRRGYLKVQIGSKIEEHGKWDKRVWFFVREGKRVKIDKLIFHGNRRFKDGDLADEVFALVRAQLASDDESELATPDSEAWDTYTAAAQWQAQRYTRYKPRTYERPEKLDSDEVFLPDTYRDAASALEIFYREQGYLSAKVSEPKLNFNQTGQRVDVHFAVNEGVQTLVNTVIVVGNINRSRDRILELTKFYYNQPLNTLAFKDLEKAIHKDYSRDGFIYSAPDISYTLAKGNTRANVIVGIYEGPQVRIGEILIKGNEATVPRTITWELTFEEGEVFDPSEMEDSRRWLQKLGIFQSVTLTPWDPEKEEDVKKLLVKVIERNRGRFGVSFGIASDEGVRGSTEFAYHNLGGYALEFHTRLKLNHRIPAILDEQFQELYYDLEPIDSLERELTVGFSYPSFMGSHISARFDLVHLRRQERQYGLDKNSFILGFSTELVRYLRISQINELAWQDSKHTYLDPIKKYNIVPPAGQTIEYSPKLQLTFDYRDSIFNPTQGIIISGMEEYFETISGDIDADLFRTTGAISGYIPIPIMQRINVLRLSLKGGIIHSIHEDTPVDKLFKLGGRSSIRGFIEEGIYPIDLNSVERIAINLSRSPSPGGDLYMLFKGDLRIPVYKSFYLGGFFDIGQLWMDPSNVNLDLDKYKSGAGGGLHYRTPVGDLSLEMGWNLNPDEVLREDSYAIHFSIGLF